LGRSTLYEFAIIMRLIYAAPRRKVRSRDVDVREQNFRAIRLIRFILYDSE